MKIGFFGTPEFSSFFCRELLKSHEILFMVSSEDKPHGRNRKLKFCPVKEMALSKKIPVFQPLVLTDPVFLDEINTYDADAYVVVSYGKKIPPVVYNHPPLKTVNLHPSLLPKYRGAAPIEWAIMNGEKVTGISVQLINEGIDTGEIILQEEVPLDGEMSSADLFAIVEDTGMKLLNRALSTLYDRSARPYPQNEAEATYCGKIDKGIAHIDWKKGAPVIHNLIRGLNPKPGAWTTFRGMNFKIWRSRISHETDISLEPGRMRVFDKKRIFAGSGDGIIELLTLQPESKKVMDSLSFINGYRPGGNEFFL